MGITYLALHGLAPWWGVVAFVGATCAVLVVVARVVEWWDRR